MGTPSAEGYERHRARVAKKQRDAAAAGRDIGKIPPVKDPRRKKKGINSLRFYGFTYFPETFYLKPGKNHEMIVSALEHAVMKGDLRAYAMPRGEGKTSWLEIAALWAISSGWRRFVPVIGAASEKAKEVVASIKIALETNELLLEDFPEIVFPIRALDGIANRVKGQTCGGIPTRIVWRDDKIVLPTIEGSKASGAIMAAAGLEGSSIRGQRHRLPSGMILRPDLVLIDDPQTRESASSVVQCDRRLQLLKSDVLGMAGPDKKIAGLMACTVIRCGDMADEILDREKNPDWQGVRTKMVERFPDNMKLWDEYGRIRKEELAIGGDGSKSTAFYKKNRKEMDKGSRVAWKERKNEDCLSAIQTAMNFYYRDMESFFSEYQNEPIDEAEQVAEGLDPDQVVKRMNGHVQGVVPEWAELITAFIDVQDRLIFYLIAAWRKDDFRGAVIDYGTYPDQRQRSFTYAKITRTLSRTLKIAGGLEAEITEGVYRVGCALNDREFRTASGDVMRIRRGFCDVGHKTQSCIDAIRRVGAAWLEPAIGVGIGAKRQPMHEFHKYRGDLVGNHWRKPRSKGRRAMPMTHVDSNYWKSFTIQRFLTGVGGAGAIELFGKPNDPGRHRMFAEQMSSEKGIVVTANGRTVEEWILPDQHRDNHFFDCMVGATVAASVEGCALPGQESRPAKRRRSRERKRLSSMRKG